MLELLGPPAGRHVRAPGQKRLEPRPLPPVEHHPVTRFYGPHAFAHLEHLAATLVAEQVGQEPVRPLHTIDLADL